MPGAGVAIYDDYYAFQGTSSIGYIAWAVHVASF